MDGIRQATSRPFVRNDVIFDFGGQRESVAQTSRYSPLLTFSPAFAGLVSQDHAACAQLTKGTITLAWEERAYIRATVRLTLAGELEWRLHGLQRLQTPEATDCQDAQQSQDEPYGRQHRGCFVTMIPSPYGIPSRRSSAPSSKPAKPGVNTPGEQSQQIPFTQTHSLAGNLEGRLLGSSLQCLARMGHAVPRQRRI